MKIDVLSKTTLKLTLTAEDMDDYSLKYESLTAKTAESRKTLCTILRELYADGGIADENEDEFLFDEKRFFIEAFPRIDGGCLLYISTLFDKGKSGRTRSAAFKARAIICELEDEAQLCQLCRSLEAQRLCGKLDFSSALYNAEDRWRLLLTPKSTCHKRIEAIFNEYGTLYKSVLSESYTLEHFNRLVPENATEIISECF